MLQTRQSHAKSANPEFVHAARGKTEDNVKWLDKNLPDVKDWTPLVLLGGNLTASFRLRVAQSVARHDLTPSHWSHVLILGRTSIKTSTPCYEISLEPSGGFGFPPKTNAVQSGRLSQYKDPAEYPNIAVAMLPVSFKEVKKRIEEFQRQRGIFDAVELTVAWLAHVWGLGGGRVPFYDEQGMPSAAFVETVLAAAGFEITPGLESRGSCPEAIWQALRWWHQYYETDDTQPEALQGAPKGAYCVDHELPVKEA